MKTTKQYCMKTHKMTGTRFYAIWRNMINRCSLKSVSSYHYYGGRGIKVCDEWLRFEQFKIDMFPSYSETLTLDRIDNDGDYHKDNCRWSTMKEQCNNTRRNKRVTYGGETKTMTEWARSRDMSNKTLHTRVDRDKWSFERAIETPVKKLNLAK